MKSPKGDATAKAAGGEARDLPLEQAIGALLRQQRTTLGLSMVDVGNRLGLSYQQVAKYEHANNTLSIPRLIAICGVLRVDPVDILTRAMKSVGIKSVPTLVADQPHTRAALEIARTITKVRSTSARKALLFIARQLAEASGQDAAPPGEDDIHSPAQSGGSSDGQMAA